MHILSHLRLRAKLGLLMGLSTVAVIVAVLAGALAMHERMYRGPYRQAAGGRGRRTQLREWTRNAGCRRETHS